MTKTNDMTKGNITKTILLFAIPIILSIQLQQLYNIVDSYIAGSISINAFTAVSTMGSLTFIFVAIGNGFGSGTSIIISKYFGEKKHDKVKTTIQTAMRSIIVFGIFMTIIGFISATPLLNIMNVPSEIFSSCLDYLNIYMIGLVFLFVYNMGTGIFSAMGDSKTPLYLLLFSTTINIGLDCLFVYYFKFGVIGLAVATTISQGISAIILFILMIKLYKEMEDSSYAKFDGGILKELVIISVPIVIQQSIISVSKFGLQSVVNKFGLDAMAGYNSAGKISLICTSTICAMSSAMSKYTGQNFGAKKIDRIKKGYYVGLCITLTIAIISTIIVLTFKSQMIPIFGGDKVTPDMIKYGNEMLTFYGASYVFLAFKVAADGCLQGCLKVKMYLLSTFVSLGVRVVLAFALASYVGFTAMGIAFSVSWVVGGIVSTVLYKFKLVNNLEEEQEANN